MPHPDSGARDCRIDLKLLIHAATAACARSEAARQHLAPYAAAKHPDLWAGTVRDGVARGFAVRLEEAIALAGPAADVYPEVPPDLDYVKAADLRRRKDLLVASATSRCRYSRKEGLLYVDREDGLHSSNCLRFEARQDLGCLDGFVGDETTRPRLYSAQFLRPQAYVQTTEYAELRLAGRLGRGPVGWPLEVQLRGWRSQPGLSLLLRVEHRQPGWRLRARFLGIPTAAIVHACTDVREVVSNDAGGFVAFTLVRSCDRLLVNGQYEAVPGALCEGRLEHHFRLG